MKTIIQKKAYTEYFDKVLSGEKTFDVRVADFDVKNGDILELIEINDQKYPTGRTLRRTIGTIIKTKDIESWYPIEDVEKYGYIIMSLQNDNTQGVKS